MRALIPCPRCDLPHVDAPDEEPHLDHACEACGATWTDDVARVGVADGWVLHRVPEDVRARCAVSDFGFGRLVEGPSAVVHQAMDEITVWRILSGRGASRQLEMVLRAKMVRA